MSWTRRELLRTLTGLPVLAATGCLRGGATPLPEGGIVGPAVDLGHRLRDAKVIPKPADDAWENTDTVIVGGGVAGLSAAWRLALDGEENFVLLELESAPGGTARSGRSSVTAYPWGAHYLPGPGPENRALLKLLDEFGAVEGYSDDGEPIFAEEHLCRDPQERIFYKGRWREGLYLSEGATEDDLRQWRAFRAEMRRLSTLCDGQGRPPFALPLARSSDDPEFTALDQMTMAEWLDRRGWNSSRLRWLVDYACRDDYGLRMEDTSAWAGVFYFASRVARGRLDARPILTWPEGNGKLVEHLSKRVGEHVRLGLAVADINPTGEGAGVEVVAIRGDGPPRGFRARRVVFAAPRFLASHVIRPWRDDPPAFAQSFEYGAWLVANLFLKGRPFERSFPLCWDNVIYESRSLGYVTATHQRGPEFGPTVLTYYYPFCDARATDGRRRLLEMDYADAAELALADLQYAHADLRPLVERIDVVRWGHAMIRPKPGFIWGPGRRAAAQPFRGISFAHTDLSGMALFEEAFYHGARAAEEILRVLRGETKSMFSTSA